jgi:hypothetical protein
MLNAKVRTVHEDVLLDGVPVQVDVEVEPLFVSEFEFFGELYQEVGLWEGEFARLVEGAVQILPEKTGPIVASYHSVGVQHRQHIEDVVFPELLCGGVVPAKILQHAFRNERGVGLPGVHAAGHQHYMLIVLLFLLVGDFEDRDGQPTQRAERRQLLEVGELGEQFEQTGVGVGDAVGEVDGVARSDELIRKRHGKICV